METQGVIESVLSQHAEEAAFLWLLRNNAVHAPHYSLKDLAGLDDRVEAHLDGLRIAGDAGWEICKEGLSLEGSGEVFAAGVLAFESGEESRINEVLVVGSTSPELSRGIVSALGWIPFDQVKAHLHKLFVAESPAHRRIGIAGFAVHRQNPGQALKDALAAGDPSLKARALKAVGELGRGDLLPAVQAHLNAADHHVLSAASWTAALFGDRVALSLLRSMVEEGGPQSESACRLLCRRMDLSEANRFQRLLAGRSRSLRLAVIAAGTVGDPVQIPWLIEQMTVPPMARVAGEALTMITGLDIAYEDFEGDKPQGFEAGPTEHPDDEHVEMDPDEDLPWPNPEKIQQWWGKRRIECRSGVRHLLGKPISDEGLMEVLRTGRQRHRAAAALELAISHPGRPLFEVRAPGFSQLALLQSGHSARRVL